MLDNAGTVTAEQTLRIAEREYELFDRHRKQLDSNMDNLINKVRSVQYSCQKTSMRFRRLNIVVASRLHWNGKNFYKSFYCALIWHSRTLTLHRTFKKYFDMEARQNNPFDGLDIQYPKARYGDGSIKQKAFFEHGSYESELVPYQDRIEIMTRFVLEGYDMHKLVDNYLEEKDALNDDRRKSDIAYTFEFYASTFALNFLDGFKGTEPISDNLKLLLRQFFKTDMYLLDKGEELQHRISVFVNWVKELGTSRERTHGGWPKKC